MEYYVFIIFFVTIFDVCMTREQMRNHDNLPGSGAAQIRTGQPWLNMVVHSSPGSQSESVLQNGIGPCLGFGFGFGSTI